MSPQTDPFPNEEDGDCESLPPLSENEEALSDIAARPYSLVHGNNQPTPNQSIIFTETSWKETKKQRLNQDSLVFSTRVAVALTLCSLFILLDNPNPSERVYPDATWIYTTTCIVLWLSPQHPLDAASVSIQTLRMLLGSIVAAALSISLGSLAVLINNDSGRAFFMGCCIAVVTFGYCFLVVRYNLLPDMSASLGLFLFCLSLFPFLADETSAWRDALIRVWNTWFGCFISLITSLFVFPRSTRWTLQQQLVDQVELAGDCVQLLLAKACKVLSGNMTPRNLTSLLETTRKGSDPDETHEAYTAFLHDLFASTVTMDLLEYNFCCRKQADTTALRMEADQTTAQAFLVASTVMILDSYVQHQTLFVVNDDTLETVNRLGFLIKAMLTTTVPPTETEKVAENLLLELVAIRHCILQVAKEEQESCFMLDLKAVLSRPDENIPLSVSAVGNELFFLLLIEQLVLQSLRLHYIWIQNKECLDTRGWDLSQALSAPPINVDAQTPVEVQDSSVGAASHSKQSQPQQGTEKYGEPNQLQDSHVSTADKAVEEVETPVGTIVKSESSHKSHESRAGSSNLLASGMDKDSTPSPSANDLQSQLQDSNVSTSAKTIDEVAVHTETNIPVSSLEFQEPVGPAASKLSSSRKDNDSASSSTTVEDIKNTVTSESSDSQKKEENDAMREDRKEEAAKFGIRMSVMVTLSSLFILLDSPDPDERKWPQGTWVLVSTVVVAWYPTLDTASVVRKTVERMFGTCMAAILGWTCGLLAVLIHDDEWRMVLLGICNVIVTFFYSLIGYRSEVYGSHQYGSFVGIFTFYIVLVPFTSGHVESWWTGLYRIINVLIGALIACFSALLIFPRSTKNTLRRRLTQHVVEAGFSVNTVLSAEESNGTRDDAYRTILADQKASRDLFAVLSADPFLERSERKRTSDFRKEAALTLARLFRIETTAVLLENNKPNSLTMPEFCIRFGTNIEALLKVDARDAEALADEILTELTEMQPLLLEARIRVSQESSNIKETVADMREALCRLDGSIVPLASREMQRTLVPHAGRTLGSPGSAALLCLESEYALHGSQ